MNKKFSCRGEVARCFVPLGDFANHSRSVKVIRRDKLRRLPATSVTKLPRSGAAECITLAVGPLTTRDEARYWWKCENRDFCLPYLHSTPPLWGSPSEYCHNVWCGKTRMVWLPDDEQILKIPLFVSTEYTNVTDTQTDGRTDTA